MSEVKHASQETNETNKQKRPLTRIVGILLIGTAVLIAWLLLVSFLGYQSGQQLLADKQEAEFTTAIARQIELAQADMAAEKYDLATVRLEWVLERDPNNQDVSALQTEIQTLSASAAEPTPMIEKTAVPTPLAEDEAAEDGSSESPSEELQRIRRLIATKTWDEALQAIHAFQMTYPNFERNESDALLYDIYIEYGLELLNSDKIELGLNYLTQAEKLGNLPQEVLDYRTWATFYTQGISYYGVNWDVSAFFLRDLCLSAPFYQNSCDRFYEVVVNLADQYAANLDWCPALLHYEEASFQRSSAELNEKIGTAREMCLQATVTPSEPISGTVPISDTQQIISPTTEP